MYQNTPVDQILSMTEMIEAIEEALKELRLGRGFDLPRRRIHHPNRMIFGLLPGSVHGIMGAYLQTDLDRRRHNETVILYSVETGEPLILFRTVPSTKLVPEPRGESAPNTWRAKTPGSRRFWEARLTR